MTATTDKQRLAEAREARHLLRTGQLPSRTEYDGIVVEFALQGLRALEAYIAELEGKVEASTPRRRCYGVIYD